MARASAPKSTRRIPSQERSKERVSRILDAAAHEFADKGIEAATIEAIAERAETSVGSIYQFYPNKHSLYEALGARYLEEVRSLFAVLVSDEAVRVPWQDIIGAAIDAFAELHRSSVTFRAVWTNILYSRHFLDAGQALNRELADRAGMLLERFGSAAKSKTALKKLPPARRKLVATTLIESTSALLLVAVDMPRPQANAMLDEAKALACRYLEPYLR